MSTCGNDAVPSTVFWVSETKLQVRGGNPVPSTYISIVVGTTPAWLPATSATGESLEAPPCKRPSCYRIFCLFISFVVIADFEVIGLWFGVDGLNYCACLDCKLCSCEHGGWGCGWSGRIDWS